MERLERFEKMLADIKTQSDFETAQMEKLKATGKEKSATYRQYFGNRMIYYESVFNRQADDRFIWHSDWILENLIRMSKQADRPNCEYGQQVRST